MSQKKKSESEPVKKKSRKTVATKKKPVAKKDSTKSTQPKKRKRAAALSEFGTHRLRRDQLMKYRMLEAEASAEELKVRMADMALKTIIQQTPSVNKAMHNLDIAKRSFKEKRDLYLEYMSTLSESVGLDLSKCTIDDQSGIVREIGENAPK